MSPDLAQASAAARRRLGYRTVAETARLAEAGILMLDPFSTLVSREVTIEPGATLYPNVILRAENGGRIAIAAGAELWPGVVVRASRGRITVGPGAEIGYEGGFTITAGDAGAAIGARARLAGGGAIQESGFIGDGAQILGPIAVRFCTLEGGGDYAEPDPDRRGAVLKGSGQARRLTLGRGRVVQAFGIFDAAEARWQSFFHPPAAR